MLPESLLPKIHKRSRWTASAAARARQFLRCSTAAVGFTLLSGCSNWDLIDPKGSIGVQERDLIALATGLMLLVVIPVIILTLVFAWRYRENSGRTDYAPTWSHSTRIEVVVWSIPCIIIAFLAVLIWDTTHKLDPYKPLVSAVKPIEIDVVALDWKWLFIYPEYGVATVNYLPVPAGTPINFRLTSQATMNSFFIPRLGSQIYAMAGMQTKLHLIADVPGTYAGRSAAYSGAGFSDMHFDTVAMPAAQFKAWAQKARAGGNMLDERAYARLSLPGTQKGALVYSDVTPGLFDRVVDQYMGGKMSKDEQARLLCDPKAVAMNTQRNP